MTDPITRRTYLPGSWFGIFGASATVLLPPSEKARVAALWALIDDGAGFDEVLDALISTGLRDLPGFVLVSELDGATQVVVRGAARAEFDTEQGLVEIAGSSATTWVEHTLGGVTRISLVVEEFEGDERALTIGAGLVRLARVDAPPPAAEVEEATLAAAEPEPEPDSEDSPEPDIDAAAEPDSDADIVGVGAIAVGAVGAVGAVAVGGEVPVSVGAPQDAAVDVEADEVALEDAPNGEQPLNSAEAEEAPEAPSSDSDSVPGPDAEPEAQPEPEPEPEMEDSPEPDVDDDILGMGAIAVGADVEADEVSFEEAPTGEQPLILDEAEEAAEEPASDRGLDADPDPGLDADPEPEPELEPEPEIEESAEPDVDDDILGVGAFAVGADVEAPAGESEPEPEPESAPESDPESAMPTWAAAAVASTEVIGHPEPSSDEPADEEPSAVTPVFGEPGSSVARISFSTGEQLEVFGPIIIGRAPDASKAPGESGSDTTTLMAVSSPSHEISSTHLDIRPGQGIDLGLAVATDLNSTNGSIVMHPGLGPRTLRPGVPEPLFPGTVIDLGDGLTIQIGTPQH